MCAKNYRSWWKFDKVMAKTILHSFFFETRCITIFTIITTTTITSTTDTVAQLLLLLGGIAHAEQAIPPIPTHFSIAWSVCLSSVTLVHPAQTARRI